MTRAALVALAIQFAGSALGLTAILALRWPNLDRLPARSQIWLVTIVLFVPLLAGCGFLVWTRGA